MTTFVRFQSASPNRHGRWPGIFAMANGLAQEGMLSPADATWLREANDSANEAYPDPTTVAPDCYDRTTNPGARSWFRAYATLLLDMVPPYLDLLDRYGIGWTELRTSSPGRITYQDEVQVVAVPQSHPADWPFPTSTPATDIATLVIECTDAAPMVDFYAALGAVPHARFPNAFLLGGLTLSFQERPDHRRPSWPDPAVQPQLHLDFFADDIEATAADLVSHGGQLPEHQPHRTDGLIVILDPAGHPCCIGTRL
ncbi:VOC family protein [Nakamurella alba]|uniref:VOC family protein n=1 Tax=Nakamurella alba TaxID=2665158 RepID=UPI0018AB894B|nr:VOC family protein [Nakamurella alba]